ncbi:MAG: DNA-binding protein WhiA [Halanaerobacter sp.]
MSFSNEVKNEVIRKDNSNRCCHLAELAALIKIEGSLEIINGNLALKLKSQTAAVARKIYKLLKERFNFWTEIIVRKKMYLDKGNYYIIKVPPQKGIKELLMDCGLIDDSYILNYKIKDEFMSNDCCRKAYLRGVFLGAGSISNPDSDYHLEIVVDYQEYAQELIKLFASFEIDINSRSRDEKIILYLKNIEDIITVLNIIGAHSTLLDVENLRVYREIKNQVNRKVNCETANLNKTVKAAQEQLEAIELIDRFKGLEKLSPGLEEIAHLRRENPYASMRELGEMLEPTLSKSGVNHRLRRIKKEAEKMSAISHQPSAQE